MMRGDHLAALHGLLAHPRPRPKLEAFLPLRRPLAEASALALRAGEPRMLSCFMAQVYHPRGREYTMET